MADTSFGVVGGGIIGLAVARRLLETRPGLAVTVLEKEDHLAAHQSGRSSGVVHAGVYYVPGSAKARLCRRGVDLLRAFCARNEIPVEDCGKVLVALDEPQRARMEALYERALQNGVPGVRLVSAAELVEIEPHVVGVAGLYSPETAIVDFAAVVRALAAEVESRGGSVVMRSEVTGFRQVGSSVAVAAGGREHVFDRVVICGGLQTDRLARLAGDAADPLIVPFRGEYYVLRPERRGLVRGLVYPVPDPGLPFLGVHLTKRHDGEVLVGPNAVLAWAREGYRRRDVVLRDTLETIRWPGFRRLARSHWRTGMHELAGSLSKRRFVREAQRYVPELRVEDVVPGPAGVRAQALDLDGTLVDDFRIHRLGRVTAIRNAPSPGATSSLAIAEHIVDQLDVDG